MPRLCVEMLVRFWNNSARQRRRAEKAVASISFNPSGLCPRSSAKIRGK